MQGFHWLLFIVALAIGYALRGIFPQPAQALGLP